MMLLLHSEATQYTILARTELTADLPHVMGDRVQLQQVLLNLMMNGIDAMKDVDGARELTIQSHCGEVGQVLISVSGKPRTKRLERSNSSTWEAERQREERNLMPPHPSQPM